VADIYLGLSEAQFEKYGLIATQRSRRKCGAAEVIRDIGGHRRRYRAPGPGARSLSTDDGQAAATLELGGGDAIMNRLIWVFHQGNEADPLAAHNWIICTKGMSCSWSRGPI
jgi:hypothetical protein